MSLSAVDVSGGSLVATPGPMTTPQMTSTAVKAARMEVDEGSEAGSEADYEDQ